MAPMIHRPFELGSRELAVLRSIEIPHWFRPPCVMRGTEEIDADGEVSVTRTISPARAR